METKYRKTYQIEATNYQGDVILIYLSPSNEWEIDDKAYACLGSDYFSYETLEEAEKDIKWARECLHDELGKCISGYSKIRIMENIETLTRDEDDEDFEGSDFSSNEVKSYTVEDCSTCSKLEFCKQETPEKQAEYVALNTACSAWEEVYEEDMDDDY